PHVRPGAAALRVGTRPVLRSQEQPCRESITRWARPNRREILPRAPRAMGDVRSRRRGSTASRDPRARRRGWWLTGAIPLITACSVAQPAEGPLTVERGDIHGAERVDAGKVEDAIATTETHHILGGLLDGVPILGIFDTLTIEYHRFDRLVLERDLERVRRHYQARGHYEAEVRAGRVVRASKGQVRVEIEVHEGV